MEQRLGGNPFSVRSKSKRTGCADASPREEHHRIGVMANTAEQRWKDKLLAAKHHASQQGIHVSLWPRYQWKGREQITLPTLLWFHAVYRKY